jgi:hypothetical protein
VSAPTTNTARARWADEAVRVFLTRTGSDLEDCLCDLLADLMHWADRCEFDLTAAFERARDHYVMECIEEGVACLLAWIIDQRAVRHNSDLPCGGGATSTMEVAPHCHNGPTTSTLSPLKAASTANSAGTTPTFSLAVSQPPC